MKIDMVKPIPPNIPAPIIFDHFNSFGKTHHPKLTPRSEKRKIPNGFPTISPNKIPIELECVNPSLQFESIAIQVLATANNGRMIKATG